MLSFECQLDEIFEKAFDILMISYKIYKKFLFVGAVMKLLFYAMLVSLGLLMSGCSAVVSPVAGAFYTGTKSALMVTGETIDESKKKIGEAECRVILGFAFGDCTIETAVKNAGIKKIHHVDSESLNVLGIFGSYKVIVTGE